MEAWEVVYHDHSGKWFPSDAPDSGELMPHQAAALLIWHRQPIPPALVPVVCELLGNQGESLLNPPARRQRAPRKPSEWEEYAFGLDQAKHFKQAEIAKMVEQKFQRSCNQGQVSKWLKKVRAWETGEIYTPHERHKKRTVNRAPKTMERLVADRSGEHVNPGTGLVTDCGGGARVIRKSTRDANDREC